MLAIQHALRRGNRLSADSWDFLRQNNIGYFRDISSSLETHLTEMAVGSGGWGKGWLSIRPGWTTETITAPSQQPEMCPVSQCSCSARVAKEDATSARLHNCTVLIHPEALELNCSRCRCDPTDRHGSHTDTRREETFPFVRPMHELAVPRQRKQAEKTYFQHCFIVWRRRSSGPQCKFTGISFNVFSHSQFWGLVWRRDDERFYVYEAPWDQKPPRL